MFEFKNTESFDFHKRNLLLQKSLRHSDSPIPIEEEYPLVLSSNQLTKSYCGYLGNKIVTHSNLISKLVINDSNCKNIIGTVGLIGNLATDPNFRGKGLMRKTLTHMENIARKNGDLAIYLWSDLESFYKKLGFIHAGTEFRYEIKPTDVGILKSNKNNISVLSGCDIKPYIAKNLLKIRKKSAYTLKRSNEDFCTLLKIPDTHLIINSLNGQIQAYAIIGKGADFIGIVHEWGHRDFCFLIAIFNFILKETNQESITVLSPSKIHDFDKRGFIFHQHPMGFVKILNHKFENIIENLYIWGLDSI